MSCWARWAVEDADDGEDEESFADLEHGGGEFADGVLLLADDAFALFDEADGDGVGDAVGGGFVGVEDAVEQVEVVAVFFEEGSGEDVAEEQDDADDFVGFDSAGDDAFGEVAGVAAEFFDAAGFEDRDVVVVDRGDLGKHFLCGHRRQQSGVGDPLRPLLTQRGAVGLQMRHQLGQQRRVVSPDLLTVARSGPAVRHVVIASLSAPRAGWPSSSAGTEGRFPRAEDAPVRSLAAGAALITEDSLPAGA